MREMMGRWHRAWLPGTGPIYRHSGQLVALAWALIVRGGALDEILLKHGSVRCHPTGKKSHNRVIAVCHGNTPKGFKADIGQALSLQGLAVGHRSYGGELYMVEEKVARKNRRGVWKDR